VTLIFYPKLNPHINEPKCTCDQNWVKFPLLVFETRYSHLKTVCSDSNVFSSIKITMRENSHIRADIIPSPIIRLNYAMYSYVPVSNSISKSSTKS